MISVIIPLYNAIDFLEPLLNRLSEQTLPHELILIDSSSTDGTPEWLSKRQIPFHSIPTTAFNHGSTRNLGVSMATSDYIVMLTQDALPTSPNSLAQLVRILESDLNVALAYGRQVPYPNATPLSKFARQTNYPAYGKVKSKDDITSLGIRTCHCSNSFAVYRKTDLESIGGFPSDVILGEDVVVAAQFILNGLNVAYCSESKVLHSHNYTVAEEFKRYFDIGTFHDQRYDLLKPFLKVESEGVKYVISEWKFLKEVNNLHLIPNQLLRTIVKLLGYRLGRSQKYIPKTIKVLLSMHCKFWLN